MNRAKLVSRAVLLAAGAATLCAQERRQPAFDVASVKASRTSAAATSNFPLGPGNAYISNGGYFSATNYSLMVYIAFAYKLMPNQIRALMDHAPAWVTAERFDIQARADGNADKDQMRMLMRTLLAERFKLVMHEEERQVAVAALVVAKAGKLGPAIQPHPADVPCPTDVAPEGSTADGRFPLLCSGILQMAPSVAGRVRYGGRNVTLDFIAKSLSAATSSGRPMVNRTGLSGNFDFSLEWTQERGPGAPSAEVSPEGLAFEAAVREQLGLKLESQKGALSFFVIDHVERPSGN